MTAGIVHLGLGLSAMLAIAALFGNLGRGPSFVGLVALHLDSLYARGVTATVVYVLRGKPNEPESK